MYVKTYVYLYKYVIYTFYYTKNAVVSMRNVHHALIDLLLEICHEA